MPGGVAGKIAPAGGSSGVGRAAAATGVQCWMPRGTRALPPPSTWVGVDAILDVPQNPQWVKAATTVAPQFSQSQVEGSTGTWRAPRW